MLKREQITPIMEKALRESAKNVKEVLGCGLKVLLEGQYRTIELPEPPQKGD